MTEGKILEGKLPENKSTTWKGEEEIEIKA
jgi:hypothetical protein